MEFYVGTSGWSYNWNEGGNFDWFIANSGLNAVELNASFYRFPFPSMIRAWAKKGKSLRWSIKVNRLITHRFKFGNKAFQLWKKFQSLFSLMDELIDFYLFQLPPFLTSKYASRIGDFARKTELGERLALEVRSLDWFHEKWLEWASSLGITWVSVDSPDFPLEVFNANGIVYERMHGRTIWYGHVYTEEELKEVLSKILNANPGKAYVFFNNDHGMLVNSRRMLKLFERFCGR